MLPDGGGGAARAGTRFAVFAARGAAGAGRPGTMLGWFMGLLNCIGGLDGGALLGMVWGTGGGALGFSKLPPILDGKRGLIGGLVIVARVVWLPAAVALLGMSRLSPDCDGS